MASAAAPRPRPGRYKLVAYIQAHGLVIKPEGQVETRQHGPKYEGKNIITNMTELSIPGDQFISGAMGPMKWPKGHPHWLGRSTESVIPGILRAAFMGRCDNPDNINDAFRRVIEDLKGVYAAARINFKDSEGGFTVRENPPDHQWWRLRRNWGETRRKTPGELPKREASDGFVPLVSEGYGVFGVCSDHPHLQNLCLTSLNDEAVVRTTQTGDVTSDFIERKLFPRINMIGHNDAGTMLGAAEWIKAINESGMDAELQAEAEYIIKKAWADKSLYSQHFNTVLQALDIGHVWLINPTCRDLCDTIDAPGMDQPPSPLRNAVPDSVSPPRTQQRTQSPPPQTPPQTPPQPPASGRTSSNLFGLIKAPDTGRCTGKGKDKGGSRKPRRRTTSTTRRKMTRKTKKRVYKRKSQKRNRRTYSLVI